MHVRLQGKTRANRHRVTAGASDAVGEAGGYILDYQQFSNLAVCFTIELPPAGFAPLRQRLTELGVVLEAPTEVEMAAATSPSLECDVRGTLRLEFQQEEPDLRIPIPAVPG
jgi:hypothetical protein